MKVFLCWSGERSRHVAEAFESFLKQLNEKLPVSGDHAFVPFRSVNIEKGLPWFQAVERELATADAALVTITPENCESPWMHYEAGAIANGIRLERSGKGKDGTKADALKGRLFTYLFGIEARDLTGPLAAYQSTSATYDDTRALVRRLLTIAGAILPTRELDPAAIRWERRFRSCWNKFVERVRPCLHQQLCDVIPDIAHKFRRLTFEEPVARCHRQAWTDRIRGCHEVFTDLQCLLGEVKERCRPFEAELYQQLLTALDGYEMTMQAYLVEDKTYGLGADGKLAIPEDIEWACENRRHIVLSAVSDLLDPQRAPVFDESAAYDQMETFAEKKSAIHRKKSQIVRWLLEHKKREADAPLDNIKVAEFGNAPALPDKVEFERAGQSSWDFDKVIYYLTHAESIRLHLSKAVASQQGIVVGTELRKNLLRWLNDEAEKIRAKRPSQRTTPQGDLGFAFAGPVTGPLTSKSKNNSKATPSRIPMYYALGVLNELVKSHEDSGGLARRLGTDNVEEYTNILRDIIKIEVGLESQVRTRAELLVRRIERLCEPTSRPPQPRSSRRVVRTHIKRAKRRS